MASDNAVNRRTISDEKVYEFVDRPVFERAATFCSGTSISRLTGENFIQRRTTGFVLLLPFTDLTDQRSFPAAQMESLI
jgi:hypothetical protein